MKTIKIDWRSFLKTAGMATTVIGISGKLSMASVTQTRVLNTLPRWRGFNLLDYFSPDASTEKSSFSTTEDDFK